MRADEGALRRAKWHKPASHVTSHVTVDFIFWLELKLEINKVETSTNYLHHTFVHLQFIIHLLNTMYNINIIHTHRANSLRFPTKKNDQR